MASPGLCRSLAHTENYLTLLPGESRQVEVQCPAAGARCAQVAVRGWNVAPLTIEISGEVR